MKPKTLHILAFISPGRVELIAAEDGRQTYARCIRLPVDSPSMQWFALSRLCEEMNLRRLESAIG